MAWFSSFSFVDANLIVDSGEIGKMVAWHLFHRAQVAVEPGQGFLVVLLHVDPCTGGLRLDVDPQGTPVG